MWSNGGYESDGTGRQAAKGGLQWVVDGRVAGEWEGVRGKKKSGDTIRASCERRGDGSWPSLHSQRGRSIQPQVIGGSDTEHAVGFRKECGKM